MRNHLFSISTAIVVTAAGAGCGPDEGPSGSGGGSSSSVSPGAGGGTSSSSGAGGAGAAGGQPGAGGGTPGPTGSTAPNLLVAFIGDQGDNTDADAVLELIKRENAAATVHNGDFDYVDNPSAWNDRIDRILGADYPYFAVVGNHDAAKWNGPGGYASYIQARLQRVPDMKCTGEPGVKETCNFRGLYMVQSCIGTSELRPSCAKDSSEQVEFIRESLANDSSMWSICNWHKNQSDMQVGGKPDEVGWKAYEECMKAGAIISTGHEHSYARTLTLTKVGDAAAGHGATPGFDRIELGPSQTFVFVSGLGGKSVRNYSADLHDDDTWWASYYSGNKWMKNGTVMSGPGTHGAMFIRFNVDGNPKRAQAYFKDVNGRIADEFTIQVP